jgi:signal transduction histidine kinase
MSAHLASDSRSKLLARLRQSPAQKQFLHNASKLMARTTELSTKPLDVESTLNAIARLTLPHQGVWTIVDLREGDQVRRVAIAHPVRAMRALTAGLVDGWPPARAARGGTPAIFGTSRSEVVTQLDKHTLQSLGGSSQHRALLRALEVGSVLVVAMQAHGEVVGSLTFVAPSGGHKFDDRDRKLAEQLAAGAALAIQTARRQAQAAATAAGPERVSFISALSQGFRTPLHNIFGYAQLLEAGIRGPLSDGQRKDIGRIRENERHLINLVDAVMNFAQWYDQEPSVLEDVVVRDALRLPDQDILAAAMMKGVAYEVDHEDIPAELTVRADRLRLSEILKQVLDNAVKFSRPGATVRVRTSVMRGRVAIEVSDTGVGIDPADLDLIFHPFVRGRDDYVLAQEGAGLGLAISRTLAGSMDAAISVITKRGEGSTFTLTLRGAAPEPRMGRPHRRAR